VATQTHRVAVNMFWLKAEDTIPYLYAHAVLLNAFLIMHELKRSLLADADGNGMLRIIQVILAP
jgi:hypothetical protein